MKVANLYFIKSANGLFYYAVDYVTAFAARPRVLVRPVLYRRSKECLPDSEIVACSPLRFLREIWHAYRRDAMIYTPSSHPIPFLNQQWVVLHDTFPFAGVLGRLKEFLFTASARTSSCRLAYINRSEGLAFYVRHKFQPRRTVFAPNRFPGSIAEYGSKRRNGECRLIIGLVGTDSPKKRYEELFSEIRRCGKAAQILFCIYGYPTDYFYRVSREFPELSIELVDSDSVSISDFLSSINALVSIAQNEGFGRPIAGALQSGIPCFLTESKVFREFFSGGAFFFPTVEALVTALSQSGNTHEKITFKPPPEVGAAFAEAVMQLQQ